MGPMRDALKMRDFGGGTLFDGDAVAIGDGEIEGGKPRGDIEGNVFSLARTEIWKVRSCCGVAVGGDAVGAGDDGANFFRSQEVTTILSVMSVSGMPPL